MLNQIFATKLSMTQAWTNEGRRLPITRCKVEPNQVVSSREVMVKAVDEAGQPTKVATQILEIGYGAKKIKRMTKPQRAKLEKAGISVGVKQVRGIRDLGNESGVVAGAILKLEDIFSVGDVVEVQGTSKGKGFAGVMKRWNFSGGPATHGQSDRARAPGSIGQRTQPGRVHKGHHMAGHMGAETVTVSGLTVVHIDTVAGEIWLSGPIPGANNGIVRLSKTGETNKIELDIKASGIKLAEVKEETTEEMAEEKAEVESSEAETVEKTETEEVQKADETEAKAEVASETATEEVAEKKEA